MKHSTKLKLLASCFSKVITTCLCFKLLALSSILFFSCTEKSHLISFKINDVKKEVILKIGIDTVCKIKNNDFFLDKEYYSFLDTNKRYGLAELDTIFNFGKLKIRPILNIKSYQIIDSFLYQKDISIDNDTLLLNSIYPIKLFSKGSLKNIILIKNKKEKQDYINEFNLFYHSLELRNETFYSSLRNISQKILNNFDLKDETYYVIIKNDINFSYFNYYFQVDKRLNKQLKITFLNPEMYYFLEMQDKFFMF